MTLGLFWNNFEMTSMYMLSLFQLQRALDRCSFNIHLFSLKPCDDQISTILFRVFNKLDQCYDYLAGSNFRCTLKFFSEKKASNILGLQTNL